MIETLALAAFVCRTAGHAGRCARTTLCAAFLAGAALSGQAANADEGEREDWQQALANCIAMTGTAPETASGRELPRFVSLRFGTVNLRQGPGDDYRINWVYKRKGMPLLVIAEHDNWRRVCDFEETTGWIHRSQLMAVQSVMVMRNPTWLRTLHEADARVLGRVGVGDLLRLERRHRGWCLVGTGGLMGWTPKTNLWGVLPE